MHLATLLFSFHALIALSASVLARTEQAPSSISQFEVQSLPDSPSLSPSWAGRIPVPDAEEGNSLFFWLFEAEDRKYSDDLISEFLRQIFMVCVMADKFLSLAQRWPGMFILDRNDNRQRAYILRWQLDQTAKEPALLDQTRPRPVHRPTRGNGLFDRQRALPNPRF